MKKMTNVLVLTLTLSILGIWENESFSQEFRKYRTKSKFNAKKEEGAAQASDNAAAKDQDEDINTKTFGDRKMDSPFKGAEKKTKYVNLNPETAFGPEIIESFDFPDSDIMEITKQMQKLTGINLILDKDVKGKISISAPTAITVGDAWKAYLTALDISGYALIKTGAFYKIINIRDVRYTPTKIYTGNYAPNTDNYIMKVFALQNVSATELSRNFRPFMSRYGRIIDIKQTNTIIVADTGTNIARLTKLIKFLDVPGHEESLQIMKVKNSSAQEIAKLLENIIKQPASRARGRAGQGGNDNDASNNISKIIAEPRTNSIIAMANAQGAKQLRELIQKLDVKLVSSSSNRIHVHYLNHGDAEEISKTLGTIVSGSKSAATKGRAGDAEAGIFSEEVKITSDKANNALVVTASPTDWLTIKGVIAKLDIPRSQVFVEGLIMETNITKQKEFGVGYLGAYGEGAVQRVGFNGSDVLGLATGTSLSLGGLFAGVGLGQEVDITLPGTTTTTKVNSVNALIKAVSTHSNTNVLATPQILAMDNKEAVFEAGETVPVLNTTTTAAGTNAGVTSQKVSLTLKLTPQINKVTRFIKLKIDHKIDDFDTGKSVGADVQAAGGVATTTRNAVTEVIVRDMDTIAMGGLMRDKETTTRSQIPLLGDIPVLGWLFKSKGTTITKVNLLFFLTPKILAPYEKTAAKFTKKLLTDRDENLKAMFDEENEDPFKGKSNVMKEQILKQDDGPLYDLSLSKQYIDNNNDNNGVGTKAELEKMQMDNANRGEENIDINAGN